jgi:hypothetical protein
MRRNNDRKHWCATVESPDRRCKSADIRQSLPVLPPNHESWTSNHRVARAFRYCHRSASRPWLAAPTPAAGRALSRPGHGTDARHKSPRYCNPLPLFSDGWASASGAEGCGFDPRLAYHLSFKSLNKIRGFGVICSLSRLGSRRQELGGLTVKTRTETRTTATKRMKMGEKTVWLCVLARVGIYTF